MQARSSHQVYGIDIFLVNCLKSFDTVQIYTGYSIILYWYLLKNITTHCYQNDVEL